MAISENIKKFRKAAGLTQKELAEKCGFATGTIQQYELGKREPRLEQQEKICDVLNIPLVSLLSGQTDSDRNGYFLSGMLAGFISEDTGDDDELIDLHTRLLSNYQRLNITGKKKAVEQVELIAEIPQYASPSNPLIDAYQKSYNDSVKRKRTDIE